MTDKIPNSPAQKRLQKRVHHQLEDAPPYSSTALVLSPSSPGRSGSSILIDCGSEGSQTKENQARRWTGKGRRTSFAALRNISQQQLTDSMGCRPSGIDQHAPRRRPTGDI